MISEQNRRDIAKKFREYDVTEFKESAIVPFLECLNHDYIDWREIFNELADLIEPESEHTCKIVSSEMFDERGIWAIELSCGHADVCCVSRPNHCSYCGAKVMGD